MKSIVVFSGSAHVELARSICKHLKVRLTPSTTSRFSNDCLGVQLEANCRQADVFIIQPLAPPVQDHLMELLLMLDNFPHIKAFWIATGVEVAQMALWYGADDLDGTVQEEKIYHMAGSRTPEILTTSRIRQLIRVAGRLPVERDTLYNVITPPEADDVSSESVARA